MEYTINFSLKKPIRGVDPRANIDDLNDNADDIDTLIHQNRTMIAPAFDSTKAYVVGDPVVYLGELYVFIADKAAGAWDATKVESTTAAEMGGGTEVIANPSGSATAELTKIDIGGTKYNTNDATARTQLNAMKTGFDGVVYPSPAAMVQACDDLIHTNLSAELKTFEDGEHQLLNGGMFTGSINSDGTIDTSINYRAYTPLLQNFDRDITIRFASPVIGFFLAIYNSSGVFQSRAFYPEAHTITAGTYFKICSAAENTQIPDVLYKATYFDSLLGTVLDEQEWDEFTKYALMNGVVLFSGKYINGGVNSSGAVDSTMKYRVTTKDILYADKKIFFKISTGWQAFYSTYQQDGTFIARTQYTTPGIYAIPQGTYFRVTISQNPEVPGTADIKTDALNVFVVKQDSQNPVRKWVAIGDSLTEVNQTATSRYCDYIAQNLNLTLVNMGVGGTGYKNGGSNENTFYARALTVPTDADVYTFFGSGNDGASTLNNAAIGDPDDTGTTTICGCMNTAFDNIYSVNPGAIIGVITPTPWAIWPPYGEENPSATLPRDNPAWMSDYADAMVAVCKRRGIPCLDLYHCSAMRPWDSTFQTLFYSKDGNNGVHPDENGHKYFITPHIQEFVKSLIQYPETP